MMKITNATRNSQQSLQFSHGSHGHAPVQFVPARLDRNAILISLGEKLRIEFHYCVAAAQAAWPVNPQSVFMVPFPAFQSLDIRASWYGGGSRQYGATDALKYNTL